MKIRDIVCAAICIDQHLLIAKRSSGVHENIWEFPGGKVELGETREQVVTCETRGELEPCVDIDRYLTTARDSRGDYTLLVRTYLCRHVSGGIHLHVHHEYTLVVPRELYSYQFEATDRPILDMLQENVL